jgi:hypothetical protein
LLENVQEKLAKTQTQRSVSANFAGYAEQESAEASGRTLGDVIYGAKNLRQTLPVGVRQKVIPYNKDNYYIDQAIKDAKDYVSQKHGVTFKESDKIWAEWDPIRREVIKKYHPGMLSGTQTLPGSGQLVKAAIGIDPDSKIFVDYLFKEFGIDLTGPEMKALGQSFNSVEAKKRIALGVIEKEKTGELSELKFRIDQMRTSDAKKAAVLGMIRNAIIYGSVSAGTGYGVGRALFKRE